MMKDKALIFMYGNSIQTRQTYSVFFVLRRQKKPLTIQILQLMNAQRDFEIKMNLHTCPVHY